jgi:pimeloyl-ACP methyl ester carboxylesterase
MLAKRGQRSIAFDRAGMGHSDPPPAPQDGEAAMGDVLAALGALGERGPLVVVGHSMGGLFARILAARAAGRVRGVVFVDAMTPEIIERRSGAAAVAGFTGLLRLATVAAAVGLMRPVAFVSGALIGLTGEALAEKRRIHGSASHARWSMEEVALWPVTSAKAAAAPLPVDLPVAVVTAGAARHPLKAVQELVVKASKRGYVEHVAGCNHSNLLGPNFAAAILRGVDHVLAD